MFRNGMLPIIMFIFPDKLIGPVCWSMMNALIIISNSIVGGTEKLFKGLVILIMLCGMNKFLLECLNVYFMY